MSDEDPLFSSVEGGLATEDLDDLPDEDPEPMGPDLGPTRKRVAAFLGGIVVPLGYYAAPSAVTAAGLLTALLAALVGGKLSRTQIGAVYGAGGLVVGLALTTLALATVSLWGAVA